MGIELVLSREQNETKLPFTTAYGRVVDVQVSADRDEVSIHVAIYGDKESRDQNGASILKKTVWAKCTDLAPENLSKDALKKAAWVYLSDKQVPFGGTRTVAGASGPETSQIVIDFSTGKAVL